MTVSVILILVMLLLSAFFSGMEIAFVSKNRLKLEIDRKQSGLLDFVAKVFERHPGQYITSILVGNNIALVVYSLYMSSLLRALAALAGWDAVAQGGSVLAETLISTVVIIFVAEYLPVDRQGKSQFLLPSLRAAALRLLHPALSDRMAYDRRFVCHPAAVRLPDEEAGARRPTSTAPISKV